MRSSATDSAIPSVSVSSALAPARAAATPAAASERVSTPIGASATS